MILASDDQLLQRSSAPAACKIPVRFQFRRIFYHHDGYNHISHYASSPPLHLHPLRDGIKPPSSSFRLDISESPARPAIEKKEGHNPSPNLLGPILPTLGFNQNLSTKKKLHLEQLQSEFLHISLSRRRRRRKNSKIKTKRKKKKKPHQPLDTPSPLHPTQQISI